MNEFFLSIIGMSLSASWLILAVLILRQVLKKAPKWIHVLLWGIVAVRLICPISIESSFSLIPEFLGKDTVFVELQNDPADKAEDFYDNAAMRDDAEESASTVSDPGVADSDVLDSAQDLGDKVISENNSASVSSVISVKNTIVFAASIIWNLGVFLFLCYAVISYYHLHNKVRTAVLYTGNIYQSDYIRSPFVMGLVRPKIYLPFGLDAQDIACVVAHENAHIRRKDHWWKPLGFLVLVTHWFNPLVWLAYGLFCKDIELACDEKVIKVLDNEQRADYSQALVSCSTGRRAFAISPLAFGEVGVKERVKSIMKYKKPEVYILIMAMLSCFVLAACFLTDPKEKTAESGTKEVFDGTSSIETSDGTEDESSIETDNQDDSFAKQSEEFVEIISQLELSTLGKTFQDMDEVCKNELLKEYGPLLEGYSMVARESVDGAAAFIIGTYTDEPKNNPLNTMGMMERGEAERDYQLIYKIEDEEIMMQEGYTETGYKIEKSRMTGYSDNGIILIQPVSAELNLHDAMASYFGKGKYYIPDAVSRGIAIHIPTEPYLSIYLVSEKYGEITENIPLTENEAQTILTEKKDSLPTGCGLSAALHFNGDSEYFNESTGVSQTVVNLAVERCGYIFETPADITDAIVEARLDCNWLSEPLYADEEDLERLRGILTNAEFGYVGGCGYAAKLTIRLASGEEMTMFKGADGCDTMVFGSYGGYFIGEEENIEFWELFGLDPETKGLM